MRTARRLHEIRLAVMFLTRLPVGILPEPVPTLAEARWAFPLAGLPVGLAGGLVFALAGWIGLAAVVMALTDAAPGALVILPWAQPLSMPVDQAPLVAMHAALILGSSVLLALGPRYITSAEVGLLILLESVFAPLLAWYFVGEDPGAYALLGGSIVVGALFASNLVVLARRKRRRPVTHPDRPTLH